MTSIRILRHSLLRRGRGRLLAFAAGPALIALAGYVLAGTPNYHIETLKCPPIGVNNHGIALVTCGGLNTFPRPYVLRDGIYIELKMPPYCKANDDDLQGVAINNRNQVLVSCVHHFSPRDQFLYDIDHDTYRWMGPRGHVAFARQVDETRIGTMVALNDNGRVLTSFAVRFHGELMWVQGIAHGTPALSEPGATAPPSELGEFKPVPPTPCLEGARFSAINDNGDIAGLCVLHKGVWSSFIVSGGSFTEVTVPGARYTEVKAMNNDGAVVGVYQPAQAQMDNHAFLFDHGRYTEVLDGPGSQFATANGINDHGAIVGVVGKGNSKGYLATISTDAAPAPVATAPPPPSRPQSLDPPAAAATTPTPRGYFGTHATVSNGILTFTAAGEGDGRPLTFKGLLPLESPAQGGGATAQMWIARDGAGYIVFTMIAPGVISGAPVSQSAGEQAYERALRAQ